ncbi:MAG: cytochrome c [Hyphomicrobiaceae bacterium]|nr:cytochrome c [Hyphomicrobiaceae bacterium]
MRWARVGGVVLACLSAGLAGAYVLTRPVVLPQSALQPRTPDVANGERIFNAGGCASCHATPGQEDRLRLGGGLALRTIFGTFRVPNISPDVRTGLGGWSEIAFANAMLHGTGRGGEHLYPSFPYTTYQRLALDDVRDMLAFLRTLPAVEKPSEPHELALPFNVRLSLGVWKWLFVDGRRFVPDPGRDAELNRGAYLVEAAAHCAECHSGRNALGGIDPARRYAGGANAEGKGWIPNITQHADGLPSWSVKDFEDFLTTGANPDGYMVEGEMLAVIHNVSRLPGADRAAMARYLKSLPPRPGKRPQGG